MDELATHDGDFTVSDVHSTVHLYCIMVIFHSKKIRANPRFPFSTGTWHVHLDSPIGWSIPPAKLSVDLSCGCLIDCSAANPVPPFGATTLTMKNSEEEASPVERQGIQVIARAAALLRSLEHQPDGMSLGELAVALALPRSTVQRIVDALDNEGLVIAASASSGVRLGPALLPLASATRFHIAAAARNTLESLSKEFGETADLSLLDQSKAVFIDQVAGRHRLSAVSAIGRSFPLHSSANGKALLAALTDAEIEKLKLRIRLVSSTPNTITTWERLDQEIATIRTSGVAYDREENSEGISALAMAIRGPSGELAAISIPVPSQRFLRLEKKLSAALRAHCTKLQIQLSR